MPDSATIDQHSFDLDAIKYEEAKNAHSVHDYVDRIHQAAEHVLADTGSPDIRDGLKNHATAVEEATAAYQHLALDTSLTDTSTWGYATIGGGVGTVNLNGQLLTHVETAEGQAQLDDVVHHELAHATLQKPMEDIMFHNNTVTAWQLYEAQAEMEGQKARGESKEHRREGQPANYAEAQTAGLHVVSVVSTADFASAMKQGDSEGLQTKIWVAGLADGSLTVDTVIAQASELGYEKGAEEAIRMHYKF